MTTVVAEAEEELELSLTLSLGRASRASHVLRDKSDLFGHGSRLDGDVHPSLERKKVGSGIGKNHGELERLLSTPPQSNYRVSHQMPSGYLQGEYGYPFKPCCVVPHSTTPVVRPCKKPRHSGQDYGHGGHGECVTSPDQTVSPARGTLRARNCGGSRSCSNRVHLRRQQSTSAIEKQPTAHLDTNKTMCPSSAGGKTRPGVPPLRSIPSMNQGKMRGNETRGMGLESEMNQGVPRMPCVSTTGNGPNGRTVRGFLYRYTKAEVTIVCVCHGSSFSPAEFVKHSGGTDVSNPLKHIVVVPSEF